MTQADDAAKAKQQQRADILAQVWSRLDSDESWTAAAFVESQGKPQEVAGLYSNLLRDLYGKKHDVPRMILMGRAGIDFCLRQSAAAAKSGDDKLATEMKGMAKVMSFNLSVNTWPAWEDEGIVITRSDQRIGLDAARLNLRLARELKRDAEKVGNAYWLLGAHAIALDDHETAVSQLQLAVENFRQAKQPDGEHMAAGYLAIARLDKQRDDKAAQGQLDAAIAELEKLGTDDATFYAQQLVSVNRYFAK